jgi:DNA-binding transcriptional LysR family regulator
VSGLGLALLGSADVQQELRDHALVQLLPDWRLPPLGTWAVTPQRDAQPAKVRRGIDALQAYLLEVPGVLR